MLNVKVEGYQQAKKVLDQLTNDLQKKILLSAIRMAAKPMLMSAKSNVPVKSGTLKKKIKIFKFRDKNASKSEVAVKIAPYFDKHKKSGKINSYYGRFIHEGTTDIRKSKKKNKLLVFDNKQGEKVFVRSVKGIKGTPFLRDAYNSSNNQTVRIFGTELANAVTRFINKNYKPIK